MDIYTIRDNLNRTIQGKEQLLEEKTNRQWFNSTSEVVANRATIEFLKANLVELRAILKDVEVVVEQTIAKSWEGVDRQGGI